MQTPSLGKIGMLTDSFHQLLYIPLGEVSLCSAITLIIKWWWWQCGTLHSFLQHQFLLKDLL